MKDSKYFKSFRPTKLVVFFFFFKNHLICNAQFRICKLFGSFFPRKIQWLSTKSPPPNDPPRHPAKPQRGFQMGEGKCQGPVLWLKFSHHTSYCTGSFMVRGSGVNLWRGGEAEKIFEDPRWLREENTGETSFCLATMPMGTIHISIPFDQHKVKGHGKMNLTNLGNSAELRIGLGEGDCSPDGGVFHASTAELYSPFRLSHFCPRPFTVLSE